MIFFFLVLKTAGGRLGCTLQKCTVDTREHDSGANTSAKEDNVNKSCHLTVIIRHTNYFFSPRYTSTRFYI
uniref:Secreted protein n=1 Tax=Anguilla anguilla TaxID=7936 RepID=A0A0E9X5V4_ANGAN